MYGASERCELVLNGRRSLDGRLPLGLLDLRQENRGSAIESLELGEFVNRKIFFLLSEEFSSHRVRHHQAA